MGYHYCAYTPGFSLTRRQSRRERRHPRPRPFDIDPIIGSLRVGRTSPYSAGGAVNLPGRLGQERVVHGQQAGLSQRDRRRRVLHAGKFRQNPRGLGYDDEANS